MEYHVRSVESASRRVSSDVAVSKRVDGNVNGRYRYLENTLENGSKINGRLRSIQTAHFGGLAALARESPPQSDPFVARRLIGSGVRKPLARRRERARASVGDSAGVAPGFPSAGRWTFGDGVRDPPIRRIWRDGFRRSACAEWPDTREYRGGRGGVARDARGEGSDRQTGSARHVSVLAHPGRYVRFPSSSRGGGHTAGSVTQPAPRQGSVAPARFFFRFRRFR